MTANSLTFRATAWIHIGFVLTGVVNTLLGPILPELAGRWGLENAQVGYLFTAQFSGSILGAVLSGWLIPRFGFAAVVAAGLGLMAAGVGTLAFSHWPFALYAVAACGMGLGFTIPASNLLIADAHPPEQRAAALNILNLAWGIGAVVWPPLVALFHVANINSLLAGLAFAVGVLALTIHPLLAEWCPAPVVDSASLRDFPSHGIRKSSAFVLGISFFLYVGTETALAGWAAMYAKGLSSPAGPGWILTPALFWAPLLLGRALAPAVLRFASEGVVFRGGLLLALAGMTTLLFAAHSSAAAAALGLAGMGLASVFPILVSRLSCVFGSAAGHIRGVMFALSGLGGATIPWLVGAVSTRYGSLRTGLTVALLTGSTILLLDLAARSYLEPTSNRIL